MSIAHDDGGPALQRDAVPDTDPTLVRISSIGLANIQRCIELNRTEAAELGFEVGDWTASNVICVATDYYLAELKGRATRRTQNLAAKAEGRAS